VITVMWWAANNSWGGVGWFWVPIMMIGCVLMMVMMMGGMMRRGGRGSQLGQDQGHQRKSAEQILADRFARGEIDEKEFTHRRELLQRR
jgi:putative membrane protein